MIRINIIPILIAIYNEYGLNEFIKRIKKILNIDLSELQNKQTTITYTNSSITLIDSNIKHTIEFAEDYYKYKKDYNSYFIIKYYDFSKIEVRKVAAFKTSDQDLLVIDEINEKDILTRRIIKTTEEDTDFIKGTFEKEKLFYRNQNTHERYKYTEDLLCNKKVSKQIKMPNNLYLYSYRDITNAVNNQYYYGYIESAMCIDKPKIKVAGRIRNNNELLISSIKTPVPNILIRGRNVIPSDKTEIELYNINIYKIGDTIQIVLNNIILPDNIITKEEYYLTGTSLGKITIEDIDLILKHLSLYVSETIYNDVKTELLNIKEQLLTNNKTMELDFFDGRFLLFNQFEYLVYDIYENLQLYESMINQAIKSNKDDQPPTLKKI